MRITEKQMPTVQHQLQGNICGRQVMAEVAVVESGDETLFFGELDGQVLSGKISKVDLNGSGTLLRMCILNGETIKADKVILNGPIDVCGGEYVGREVGVTQGGKARVTLSML